MHLNLQLIIKIRMIILPLTRDDDSAIMSKESKTPKFASSQCHHSHMMNEKDRSIIDKKPSTEMTVKPSEGEGGKFSESEYYQIICLS